MKKMLYSKFTKFIVWVLILVLTVPMMDCIYNGLNDYMELSGDNVYTFSKDFESSFYVAELLNMPMNAVSLTYVDSRTAYTVHGDGSISVQHREYTVVPTLAPQPTVSPAEAPLRDEDFYEVLEERIAPFADDERIDYYIKVNDIVYTNTDATPEELMEREFSYFAYRAPDGSGERSWNGVKGRLTGFGNFSIYTFGEDEITVCTAIDDSHADQIRRVWLQQEHIVRESFEKLLIILCVILALSAFLLATAGKTAASVDERGLMDKLWSEIYLAASVAAGIGGVFLIVELFNELFEASYGSVPEYMALPIIYISAALTVLLVLGSLIMCVRKLRQSRFLNDSVAWKLVLLLWKIAKYILAWAWSLFKKIIKAILVTLKSTREILSSFMGKKSGRYILASLFVFAFVMWLCGLLTPETPLFLLFAIVILAAAIYFLYKRTKELDEIKIGAANIRRGQLSHKIGQPKSPDLVSLVSDINHIAQGLDESVAAKLKAEKMKTELITNVSHDLKTPLTSIINYTELLSQVEDMPEEAKDYIRIIASKSERLKNLTQDLFAISKVQSGNENIVFERLDAAVLIEQALAEHEREIEASSYDFIVRLERELYFMADGKKMSRAVGNLIENILKYSMAGTRVYISATERDGKIMMEFKNIASYLMDFEADEIVGRFVRGDSSRSTEGSGLGLAIVKSYVEACHGSLDITVDGDLFKAQICFDAV